MGCGALFTIAAGISHGARASLVAAAGCTLGILPHLAAAITGTAALLQASGVAFQTVKVLGVGYLLYLAWATWRDTSLLSVSADQAPRSARRVVTSAVLVNLLNPKLTIFFAFLAYEAAVLPLLARHGGRLDRRLRTGDALTEVHIGTFTSKEGFDAYLADEERQSHRRMLDGLDVTQRVLVVVDV